MDNQRTNVPGAQPGNQNAYKGGRTSRIVVYMTPREKAGLVKRAGGKLTPWARKKLGLPE